MVQGATHFLMRKSQCMSRWELYQRTVGYAVNGVGPVVIIFSIEIVLFIWGFIFHTENVSSVFFKCLKANLIIVLFLCAYFWKYFFDITFKSVEVFKGKVIMGKLLPGTMVQSSKLGRRRQLIEHIDRGDKVPQKFIIFEEILEEKYGLHELSSKICSGPVIFCFLKRTKCIVEIREFPIQVDSNLTNKRKKAKKR